MNKVKADEQLMQMNSLEDNYKKQENHLG